MLDNFLNKALSSKRAVMSLLTKSDLVDLGVNVFGGLIEKVFPSAQKVEIEAVYEQAKVVKEEGEKLKALVDKLFVK